MSSAVQVIETDLGSGDEPPKPNLKWEVDQRSEVLGVVTTGVVSISPSPFITRLLLEASEVVDVLEWWKWGVVAESGINFGVVNISSEEVEDLLLPLSLFLAATEAAAAMLEADTEPPKSRPVILLVANISHHHKLHFLQKRDISTSISITYFKSTFHSKDEKTPATIFNIPRSIIVLVLKYFLITRFVLFSEFLSHHLQCHQFIEYAADIIKKFKLLCHYNRCIETDKCSIKKHCRT
jgi:hypothetical protein